MQKILNMYCSLKDDIDVELVVGSIHEGFNIILAVSSFLHFKKSLYLSRVIRLLMTTWAILTHLTGLTYTEGIWHVGQLGSNIFWGSVYGDTLIDCDCNSGRIDFFLQFYTLISVRVGVAVTHW